MSRSYAVDEALEASFATSVTEYAVPSPQCQVYWLIAPFGLEANAVKLIVVPGCGSSGLQSNVPPGTAAVTVTVNVWPGELAAVPPSSSTRVTHGWYVPGEE